MPPASRPWSAPPAPGPLDAVVELPGSKSLTARALLLAAVAGTPTTLTGVLRSRDTDLMITALRQLGADATALDPAGTRLRIQPAPTPLTGGGRIDCGLAGTVMRFLPPLALLADAPVTFDGDQAARTRPLAPLLDALSALGAHVTCLGEPGHLPVTVGPGENAPLLFHAPPCAAPTSTAPGGTTRARPDEPHRVAVDASSSSQFLSALLLLGPLLPGGLEVTATGPVPSLPHVTMTVRALRDRGVRVETPATGAPAGGRTWRVHPGRPRGGEVAIEPDLSNAGTFLAAALIAGGRVRVGHWPERTTQAGDAWRRLLPLLGGEVQEVREPDGSLSLQAQGTGRLRGIEADLSATGELVPVLAALAALAGAQGHASRLTGIAHLRGHETNRLAALVTEINRLGGSARELPDGLQITPAPLHPATLNTYADHRMAAFAALIGLSVAGVKVTDVACTSKTLPGFTRMWQDVVEGPAQSCDPTVGRAAAPAPGGVHGAS